MEIKMTRTNNVGLSSPLKEDARKEIFNALKTKTYEEYLKTMAQEWSKIDPSMQLFSSVYYLGAGSDEAGYKKIIDNQDLGEGLKILHEMWKQENIKERDTMRPFGKTSLDLCQKKYNMTGAQAAALRQYFGDKLDTKTNLEEDDLYAPGNNKWLNNRVKQLENLGRRLNVDCMPLLVDPGLMSDEHFDAFINFVAQKQGQFYEVDDLFKIRKAYCDTVPQQVWYRGLALDNEGVKIVATHGLKPSAARGDSEKNMAQATGQIPLYEILYSRVFPTKKTSWNSNKMEKNQELSELKLAKVELEKLKEKITGDKAPASHSILLNNKKNINKPILKELISNPMVTSQQPSTDEQLINMEPCKKFKSTCRSIDSLLGGKIELKKIKDIPEIKLSNFSTSIGRDWVTNVIFQSVPPLGKVTFNSSGEPVSIKIEKASQTKLKKLLIKASIEFENLAAQSLEELRKNDFKLDIKKEHYLELQTFLTKHIDDMSKKINSLQYYCDADDMTQSFGKGDVAYEVGSSFVGKSEDKKFHLYRIRPNDPLQMVNYLSYCNASSSQNPKPEEGFSSKGHLATNILDISQEVIGFGCFSANTVEEVPEHYLKENKINHKLSEALPIRPLIRTKAMDTEYDVYPDKDLKNEQQIQRFENGYSYARASHGRYLSQAVDIGKVSKFPKSKVMDNFSQKNMEELMNVINKINTPKSESIIANIDEDNDIDKVNVIANRSNELAKEKDLSNNRKVKTEEVTEDLPNNLLQSKL